MLGWLVGCESREIEIIYDFVVAGCASTFESTAAAAAIELCLPDIFLPITQQEEPKRKNGIFWGRK